MQLHATLRKDIIIILLLTALSGALHLWRLGFPPVVVFDEAHFATYASDYASRTGFFDIHPPLGKMLFAGVARAFGVKKPHDFIRFWRTPDGEFHIESDGGKPYGNFPYRALRTLSATTGILLIPLAYLLARLLGLGALGAGLGGLFLALDNGLLVQTRLILMDGFLLFFGLLGLVLFLAKDKFAEHDKKRMWCAAAGALALGCAGSVKLTGFGFPLGIAALVLLLRYRERTGSVTPTFTFAPLGTKKFVGLVVLPIFLFFALHRLIIPLDQELAFWHILLNNNGAEGARSLLTSLRALPFGGVAANVLGYIGDIFFTIGGNLTSGTHPSRSFLYTWPLNFKAVVYWYTPSYDAMIYFLGNVILWPFSTLAILTVIARWIWKRTLPDPASLFLLTGYMANFLPFIMFVVNRRPTYLYHYLPALICAVLLLAKELETIATRESRATATVICGSAIVLVALGFVLTSPLTYGFPSPAWLTALHHAPR